MADKLSCFSLNVRGIRDLSKRKALFLFCTSQKRDVYFFKKHIPVMKMKHFGAINGEVRFYFVMVLITPLEF